MGRPRDPVLESNSHDRHDRNETTRMTTDPWAAASAAPSNTSAGTREHTTAAAYGQENTASSLGESYAPEPARQSSLFGPTIETLPSLFTAQHAPGTKIKLRITAKPKDVQSTCHPSASPDRKSRLKQYWNTDPATGNRRPGLAPMENGKPCDPVLNLVLSGETAERDPQVEGDDGRRSWFVSGTAKPPKGHVKGNPVLSARRALLDALEMAGESGLSIKSDDDMIGLTVEVHRVRRQEPNVTTSSWFWQARITNE